VADGRDPACVEVCPTESLVFGDLDDAESPISKVLRDRKYKVLKPIHETKPKFFLLESTVAKEEIKL
jgi:Fe-S-cluster-containing dehydrogenase component